MDKMSESDFGFENSQYELIERNCRFDHLSAKHFRFEDSAPEPIQRSVFATPFRPHKGKESDQQGGKKAKIIPVHKSGVKVALNNNLQSDCDSTSRIKNS